MSNYYYVQNVFKVIQGHVAPNSQTNARISKTVKDRDVVNRKSYVIYPPSGL